MMAAQLVAVGSGPEGLHATEPVADICDKTFSQLVTQLQSSVCLTKTNGNRN